MVVLDRTRVFKDSVRRILETGSWPSDVRERAENGLLREGGEGFRSQFMTEAHELSQHLVEGWTEINAKRRDYLEEGRVPESERDQIEADMLMFVKAASDRIVRLESLVASTSGKGEHGGLATSAHETACRHGVALILSERLRDLTDTINKWKDIRFRQKERADENERRRRKRPGGPGATAGAGNGVPLSDGAAEGSERAAGLMARHMGVKPEQAQALVSETKAIWEDLVQRGQQIYQVESTVQDISQLGQILGDQVVRQSEQIEQLYFDALVATRYIGMGNEQVTKTISVTKAGTWYMFIFMMICTVLVLFFDWFHS